MLPDVLAVLRGRRVACGASVLPSAGSQLDRYPKVQWCLSLATVDQGGTHLRAATR